MVCQLPRRPFPLSSTHHPAWHWFIISLYTSYAVKCHFSSRCRVKNILCAPAPVNEIKLPTKRVQLSLHTRRHVPRGTNALSSRQRQPGVNASHLVLRSPARPQPAIAQHIASRVAMQKASIFGLARSPLPTSLHSLLPLHYRPQVRKIPTPVSPFFSLSCNCSRPSFSFE